VVGEPYELRESESGRGREGEKQRDRAERESCVGQASLASHTKALNDKEQEDFNSLSARMQAGEEVCRPASRKY
jgi:hypothetical protein